MVRRAYHKYWVYILSNKPKGTLYIGVTGRLNIRMEQHVRGEGSKFTARHKLKMLVYFEEFQYINDAIAREKQLKNGHRQWKINLIERVNPNWDNLWKPLRLPQTSSKSTRRDALVGCAWQVSTSPSATSSSVKIWFCSISAVPSEIRAMQVLHTPP